MSATTFSPSARTPRTGGANGSDNHIPQRDGGPLRAVRVFVETLFSVAVLGEYAEDAGVRRR
ncbi:hypothetical protein [Streptomyces clavuligerus]|uniref:Uncharacterized protein n=1 Tax=Streptomyces clavuligerus TaxID=1901 RepID=B5H2Q9_STRCL|nr:hypothetical protein [Streptomyces clavuligerus]ANW18926.1 hypothetical protein BB341_12125 [Streptomyces clavuligerus]AXU13502.1 hypothetical protein D1794_12560 [Streptomyces clavuligerus]EDY52855.1 hypothetical protein SSCG_05925 [Streptomyces clavuligerus]EFG08368.1 Hypothetical protein SCLAV_3297 [Streptomyces clavuligerus]MBY6303460.1 hypothetical protein [Streptomyces clavuligerus]